VSALVEPAATAGAAPSSTGHGTVAPPRVVTGQRHLSIVATLRRRGVEEVAQAHARRAPFLILVGVVLAGGLVGLLLLNTVLAQGAFTVQDLQTRSARLADTQGELSQKVADAESPAVLERKAHALGMVPSETPVFLRLSDGAVLGVPKPAKAPAKPQTTSSTSTSTSVPAKAAPANGPAKTAAAPGAAAPAGAQVGVATGNGSATAPATNRRSGTTTGTTGRTGR